MYSYNASKGSFEEKTKAKLFSIFNGKAITVIFSLPSLLWSPCTIGLLVVDINSFEVFILLVTDSVVRGGTEQ